MFASKGGFEIGGFCGGIDSAGTGKGDCGLILFGEFDPVFAQVEFFEVIDLAFGGELNVGVGDLVAAEFGGEVCEVRVEIECELFASIARNEVQAERCGTGRREVACEAFPIGEVEIVDFEIERRFFGNTSALAPAHGHWFG